jgi:hypothetical protein
VPQQFAVANPGPEPARPPRRRARLLGVLVLAGLLVLGACSSGSDKKAKSTSSGEDTTTVDSGGSAAPTTKPQGKRLKWTVPVVGVPTPFKDGDGAPTIEMVPGEKAKPGVYYFESYDGWHVRIVRGDGVNDVHGLITGQAGKKGGASLINVTGADPSVAKVNGSDFEFNVPAGDGNVSIDFNLNPNTRLSQVTFNSANGPIDVTKIYLGGTEKSPLENPITITKQ